MTLEKLFLKYAATTDKETNHRYGGAYESIIEDLGREPQKILLLGCNLFGGGDIYAFSERFPNAKIVALDIDTGKIGGIQLPNVDILKKDAFLNETILHLEESYGGFDLIIDDIGTPQRHYLEWQVNAHKLYYPLLNPGGIIAIEDVYDHKTLQEIEVGYVDVKVYDLRNETLVNKFDSVIISHKRTV